MASLHVLRSHLLSLLATLCLLQVAGAAVKSDIDANHPASVAQLQTKATQGFIKQELELAADYFAGRGVPKDLAQAAYWYRKAADQGNPAAQLYLGYMYTVGMGVPLDKAEGIQWYRRAASSNDSEAKVNLATFYMHGDGVKQDTQEALRLLRSAAEKGDGRADAYLGLANYLGTGVPVDHAAAESWFKAGVKQHDPEAAFFLVVLEGQAPGRAPDLTSQGKLLRLSAAGGYVPAIHGLGLLLVNHPELPQTARQATDLLMLSAGAGNWRSSAVLGMLSRDGRLVPKDRTAAYRWYRIAVLQGGQPAESYLSHELQSMAKGLDNIASVEQEAAGWLQVHPNHDLFVFTNQMNPKYFPIQEVYATAQAPAMDNEVRNQTKAPN
jgi:TPR repeat protein